MSTPASNLKLSVLRHTLVNAALALVEANKKNYTQSLFPQPNEVTHVCDTPYCMAGFIVQAKSPALFKRICRAGGHMSWWDEASKALKLPTYNNTIFGGKHYEGSDSLFGLAGSWPEIYSDRYYSATTPHRRYLACKARWKAWLKESDKALGVPAPRAVKRIERDI